MSIPFNELKLELYKLDYSQLNEIGHMIPDLLRARSRQAARSFRINSPVKWLSTKNGKTITGVVEKIAQKYITVRTPIGLYKVPAGMLEVA